MLIAISRSDGGVSIMKLVDAKPKDIKTEIEKWKNLHIGEYVSHAVIDDKSIPEDRYFRNAWSHDGKSLNIRMDVARDIHRDKMRAARAKKWEAADAAYNIADESGDASAKKAAAARRQALRDITKHPGIDAAQTPEELRAVWPAEIA